jgi:glucokinase
MRLHDPAAVISKNALKSPVRGETMDMFFRFLAHEAANLTLKLKATGGLFIGGGIIRNNGHVLDKTAFRSNFCNSGRLNALLQEVPVTLILNDKTALLGAAYYAAYAYVRLGLQGQRQCRVAPRLGYNQHTNSLSWPFFLQALGSAMY